MRRTRLAATSLFAVSALVAGGGVASAQTSDDTIISVQLTGGALTIDASANNSLVTASAAAGTVTSNAGNLVSTTVSDGRGSLLGWNVTAVTGGDMVSTSPVIDTTNDGVANPDTNAVIDLGDSAVTGPLTWTSQSLTAADSVTSLLNVSLGAGGALNPTAPITAATALVGAGGGSYQYDGLVTLTVPANTYAATYEVTVTQTVS